MQINRRIDVVSPPSRNTCRCTGCRTQRGNQVETCRCEKCCSEDKRSKRMRCASVVLMMEEEPDRSESMWILDANMQPVKRFIPQPQGCLQRKYKRIRNHVHFDKAWVYHFTEQNQLLTVYIQATAIRSFSSMKI